MFPEKELHSFKISNRRCRQKEKGGCPTDRLLPRGNTQFSFIDVLGAKFHRESETRRVHALQFVFKSSFKVGLNIRE